MAANRKLGDNGQWAHYWTNLDENVDDELKPVAPQEEENK